MTYHLETLPTPPIGRISARRFDPLGVAQQFHDDVDAADVGHVIIGQPDPAPAPTPTDTAADAPADASGPLPWQAAALLAVFFGGVFAVNALGWDWGAVL